jgi:hypothetical protein
MVRQKEGSMKTAQEQNFSDYHPGATKKKNYNFVFKYVFGLIGILLCLNLLLSSQKKKFTLSYEAAKELKNKMLNIIAFPEETPGFEGNLLLSIPQSPGLLQSLLGPMRNANSLKTAAMLNIILDDNAYESKIKDGSYTITVIETETKTTSVIKFFSGKSVKETNKYTFTLRDTKTGKIIRNLGVFTGEIKGLD